MNRLFASGILALMCTSCSITTPVAATSNPIGSKVGTSSGKCYFNVCRNVDASIHTAALNGNITKVSTVDYKVKSFLGIITTHECIVTGE
jgi:hypothetical protein